MKMQKSVIFVKKNLKINILKLEIIVIIEKYRGVAHSICNLKYNLPKKLPIVFNNGSNYEFNFIIKELAEDSKNNLLV